MFIFVRKQINLFNFIKIEINKIYKSKYIKIYITQNVRNIQLQELLYRRFIERAKHLFKGNRHY